MSFQMEHEGCASDPKHTTSACDTDITHSVPDAASSTPAAISVEIQKKTKTFQGRLAAI